VLFGGRSSVNRRLYSDRNPNLNHSSRQNMSTEKTVVNRTDSPKPGQIVYNEFFTVSVKEPSRSTSVKLSAILASILGCLLVVAFSSALIYGTHSNSTSTNIKYGSLNDEFSSQSLYSSSNLKLINNFKIQILDNSISKEYGITSPSNLTNYTTVLHNLWSVNINKSKNFYWIQIAILTTKGCVYFLNNHSPGSVFGAGSGTWFSTVNQNIIGCSSSVTPDSINWSGWQSF
jgi:hypothetical protein